MERVMGLTAEQIKNFIDIVGEENVKDLLAGKISVEFKEAIGGLFDKHGRRIPINLRANVRDANMDFRLNQPKLDSEVDYANHILRLHDCLSVNTGITAEQFKAETERLLALIRDNSQIANILNGVWLPIVMPPLTDEDLGATLEQYLEAVGKSYVKTFSDREFCNYRKGTLAGAVSVVDGSRHDRLIELMKQGSVIGIHFPNPLQGFSVDADREQMLILPKGFILSGMDTVIAMMMYPDILAWSRNTPGLDLAALSWQSADASLEFGAGDGRLAFGSTNFLTYARDYYSGGLLFLG